MILNQEYGIPQH